MLLSPIIYFYHVITAVLPAEIYLHICIPNGINLLSRLSASDEDDFPKKFL